MQSACLKGANKSLFGAAKRCRLFDHSIGANEQDARDRQAERLGSLSRQPERMLALPYQQISITDPVVVRYSGRIDPDEAALSNNSGG
jgi:hypothetical protein